MTKIAKALAYLQAHPEATTRAAAKHAGMRLTSLYAALRRREALAAGVCPVCGMAKDADMVKVTLTLRRSEVLAAGSVGPEQEA